MKRWNQARKVAEVLLSWSRVNRQTDAVEDSRVAFGSMFVYPNDHGLKISFRSDERSDMIGCSWNLSIGDVSKLIKTLREACEIHASGVADEMAKVNKEAAKQ